jgi:dienelactone hydrolase
MNPHYKFLLVALIVLSACSPAASPTPRQTSATPTATAILSPTSLPTPSQALSNRDWIGGITHADGTTDSIIVQFDEAEGTLTIQPQTTTLSISEVLFDRVTLSFKANGKSELRFRGRLEGSQIRGEVEQDGRINSFTLLPLVNETGDALADFSGTYQLETGEVLNVVVSPSYTLSGLDYFWSGLTLTHFGTGAIRGLYPTAEDKDTFLVGSARVLGYPFVAQVEFLRDDDGKVNGLLWQTRDPATESLGAGQQATRLALKTETVQYTSNDGITLTGLLTLPATDGPHPAMVVLHGSEPGTRDDFGRHIMSAYLASQGFAVLTYDKRGVGDSGGTYQERASESNLNLLAQDALAGVNYLKGRAEVDSSHIGLIGYSQAGWIIPIVAGQSEDVAFFVILSGPVVSVGIEDAYSNYTNNGESLTQYTAEEISQKLALASPSGFDPVPVIATLKQPGIWIWGAQDKSVPVPESLQNLEALISQGKSNFSYFVLPDADHNLQMTTRGLFNEIPYSSGYPENFHTLLSQWLQEQVK